LRLLRTCVLLALIAQLQLAATYKLPNATNRQDYGDYVVPRTNPDNATLTFRLVEGALPAGITLTADGHLHGKPSGVGTFTFTLEVEVQPGGQKITQAYQLLVAPFVSLTPPPTVTLDNPETAPQNGAASPQNPPKTPDAPKDPPCPPGADCIPALFPPAQPKPDASGKVTIVPLLANDNKIVVNAADASQEMTLKRNGGAVVLTNSKTSANGVFSYDVPADSPLAPGEQVTACYKTKDGEASCTTTVVNPIQRHGEQFHAIVGFQQSGASGSDSTQKFFFDMYVSRPIPQLFSASAKDTDSVFRWWGNVRIGTAPRSTSTAATLTALRTDLKGLKVNELAQAAEFLTGVDLRLASHCCPLWSQSADARQRFRLSFVMAFGATGSLKADTSVSDAPVFFIPGGPTLDDFKKQFGAAGDARYKYVSFLAPRQDRYSKEYFGGFRLTTHYADKYGTPSTNPPAMVFAGVGQNELITPQRFRGAVARFEAFYPLGTGNHSSFFSTIYLFGTAQLRMGGAHASFFALAPVCTDAANTMPANCRAASPAASTDNTLYIIDRSSRDYYSIGLGLDVVQILSRAKISFK
jgi:hypothetical protein